MEDEEELPPTMMTRQEMAPSARWRQRDWQQQGYQLVAWAPPSSIRGSRQARPPPPRNNRSNNNNYPDHDNDDEHYWEEDKLPGGPDDDDYLEDKKEELPTVSMRPVAAQRVPPRYYYNEEEEFHIRERPRFLQRRHSFGSMSEHSRSINRF